jgi:2-desacetyl-2-hydroxyethyl bacteriochlorophyllide A dehydrogenase
MIGRRFICPERRRIDIEEFDVASPQAGQVLIEQALTAVSTGTEIYGWLHGGEPSQQPHFPRTTGYCSTGTILEVGAGVTDLRPGDRVAAQGNHASHLLSAANVHPVPDGVSWEDAAYLTMAAIAMHGVRRAKIELGEGVVVLGLGVVGQLALSLAQLAGALPLIGLDLDVERRSLAQRRGADRVLDSADTDATVAAVQQVCAGDGADLVIEATGKPAVYPMAARLARTGGRVVALGSPRGTVEMDFLRDIHLREVDLIGAIQPVTPEADHIYYPWTKDRDRRLLLQLMSRGRLTASDLITHRAQPQECQNIYEMLADRPQEALGVVFDWSE